MSIAIGGWDRQAMRELYRDDSAARHVLDELAARHKNPNRGETSVDSLGASGIDRRTAINVLRAFADNGCGEFRVGRRGQPSRLIWLHPAIDVAREAAGGAASPTQNNSHPQLPAIIPHRTSAEASEVVRMIEQRVRVRPGVEAVIRIPEDLTQAEAEKLAGIVTNLWL
ncbi:MAG TPA: hypothetical protein VNH11_25205 [Pirellulales bacterium]|nr:hypothetical protein [Pirellulales bacterium]